MVRGVGEARLAVSMLYISCQEWYIRTAMSSRSGNYMETYWSQTDGITEGHSNIHILNNSTAMSTSEC